MTWSVLLPLIPPAIALVGAVAAYIRAEAAHRKLDDHVNFQHSTAISIVRKGGPGTVGRKE